MPLDDTLYPPDHPLRARTWTTSGDGRTPPLTLDTYQRLTTLQLARCESEGVLPRATVVVPSVLALPLRLALRNEQSVRAFGYPARDAGWTRLYFWRALPDDKTRK